MLDQKVKEGLHLLLVVWERKGKGEGKVGRGRAKLPMCRRSVYLPPYSPDALVGMGIVGGVGVVAAAAAVGGIFLIKALSK